MFVCVIVFVNVMAFVFVVVIVGAIMLFSMWLMLGDSSQGRGGLKVTWHFSGPFFPSGRPVAVAGKRPEQEVGEQTVCRGNSCPFVVLPCRILAVCICSAARDAMHRPSVGPSCPPPTPILVA